MHRSKAFMMGGMPILGSNHKVKISLYFVYQRNNEITICNGQTSTRQKIILYIYEYQGFHQHIFWVARFMTTSYLGNH